MINNKLFQQEIDPITGLPKGPSTSIMQPKDPNALPGISTMEAQPKQDEFAELMSSEQKPSALPSVGAALDAAINDEEQDINADVAPSTPAGPDVRAYLMEKYGLGPQFSNEARQKIVDENKADASGPAWAAGLAALGAGIAGRDPMSAGKTILDRQDAQRKLKLDQFDAGRKQKLEDRNEQAMIDAKDPGSERSKAAQNMLIQDYGMDPELASKLSAEQAEARLPGLKLKLDREMREREFSERQKDRQLQREFMQSQRNQAREDKLEKESRLSDKQVQQVTEFDDALGSIESIKRQKDNFDTGPLSSAQSKIAGFFGIDDSEKSAFKAQVQDDLARYIKSISGGAVSDQERAFLIQNLPTMSDNDETFKSKLDVVEKRLRRNRDNFLNNAEKAGKRVGQYRDDSAPAQEEEVTKTVNGKKYRKVPGGWEEVE